MRWEAADLIGSATRKIEVYKEVQEDREDEEDRDIPQIRDEGQCGFGGGSSEAKRGGWDLRPLHYDYWSVPTV